jgi:hypothetical protein
MGGIDWRPNWMDLYLLVSFLLTGPYFTSTLKWMQRGLVNTTPRKMQQKQDDADNPDKDKPSTEEITKYPKSKGFIFTSGNLDALGDVLVEFALSILIVLISPLLFIPYWAWRRFSNRA